MKFIKKDKTGFTILETLIAVFMFSVVITAYMSLVSKTLSSSKENSLAVIARNLSSEGIEIFDNMRNTNFLKKRNWLSGADSPCAMMYGCYGDSKTMINSNADFTFTPCPLSGCPYLKLSEYGYEYASGENTPFKRTILLNQLPFGSHSGDSVEVTSVVEWNAGSKKRTTTTRKVYTNWVLN